MTEMDVHGLSLDVDTSVEEADDELAALKSPQFNPQQANDVHAKEWGGNNAPARKLSLDVDEAGHGEGGDTLAHMSSPVAKPVQADVGSLPVMGAPPSSLQEESVQGVKQKKGLSHLSRRFQSMNDFSIAADLEAEEAAEEAASSEKGHASGKEGSGDTLEKQRSPILTHTAGTVSKALKRSQSEVGFPVSFSLHPRASRVRHPPGSRKRGHTFTPSICWRTGLSEVVWLLRVREDELVSRFRASAPCEVRRLQVGRRYGLLLSTSSDLSYPCISRGAKAARGKPQHSALVLTMHCVAHQPQRTAPPGISSMPRVPASERGRPGGVEI